MCVSATLSWSRRESCLPCSQLRTIGRAGRTVIALSLSQSLLRNKQLTKKNKKLRRTISLQFTLRISSVILSSASVLSHLLLCVCVCVWLGVILYFFLFFFCETWDRLNRQSKEMASGDHPSGEVSMGYQHTLVSFFFIFSLFFNCCFCSFLWGVFFFFTLKKGKEEAFFGCESGTLEGVQRQKLKIIPLSHRVQKPVAVVCCC